MMSTATLTCCVNVVNSQYQQQSGGQYRDRQPPHQSRWQWGWLRRPRTWSVHNHADREAQRWRSQGHHLDIPNSRDADKNSDFAYSDSDQDFKNPQNVSRKTQKVMVDLVPHLWLIKKKQKWKRRFVTQPGRTYFVKNPNVWFFSLFFSSFFSPSWSCLLQSLSLMMRETAHQLYIIHDSTVWYKYVPQKTTTCLLLRVQSLN